MSDTHITCPRCNASIPLSEALLHDIQKETLERERKKIRDELSFEQKLAQQKQTEEVVFLKSSLDQATKKLHEAQNSELELRKQKNILDEQRRTFEIEKQRQIDSERESIRKRTTEEMTEAQRIKDKEKEQYIESLKKSLEDAQRKATQGSQQLQGEAQEIDMEQTLRKAFPEDSIEPIAKGVLGADIRQTVKSPRGMPCGTILWESKRTKAWSDGWIDKLKQDCLIDKANIAAIATEALPEEAKTGIGLKNGIWICSLSLVPMLSSLLRKSLIDVARERFFNKDKQTRAEDIYTFITSHEFHQRAQMMLETYMQMKNQITKERNAFEKSWKLRESQVDRLMSNISGLYGTMQEKAGSAMRELPGTSFTGEEVAENHALLPE
jgi:hypothetical protein